MALAPFSFPSCSPTPLPQAEVRAVDVEAFRIEVAANPGDEIVVLGIAHVLKHGAVLGRAGACAGHTQRVGQPRVELEFLLDLDVVAPPIAEVLVAAGPPRFLSNPLLRAAL